MSIFTYVSRQPDGTQMKGSIEALNQISARDALADMGFKDVDLTELPENFTIVRTEGETVHPIIESSAPPTSAVPDLPESSGASISSENQSGVTATVSPYYPIMSTVRLYAGWLLAWYFVIFAIGSYEFLYPLPFQIPYLDTLFLSPTILSFAAAAFLFLLFSSIHRILGRGILKGIILTTVGIVLLFLFRQNL